MYLNLNKIDIEYSLFNDNRALNGGALYLKVYDPTS